MRLEVRVHGTFREIVGCHELGRVQSQREKPETQVLGVSISRSISMCLIDPLERRGGFLRGLGGFMLAKKVELSWPSDTKGNCSPSCFRGHRAAFQPWCISSGPQACSRHCSCRFRRAGQLLSFK